MKPPIHSLAASAAIAFSALTAIAGAATTISITNPSFEAPVLAANGAAVGTPTGWAGSGTVGYVANGWNGGAINISNLDGNQAGWFNTDVGTSISQLLTDTYTVGQSYQLAVGAVKLPPHGATTPMATNSHYSSTMEPSM